MNQITKTENVRVLSNSLISELEKKSHDTFGRKVSRPRIACRLTDQMSVQ